MLFPDSDTLVTRLRAAGCVFAEEEAELLLAATSDPEQLESLVARRIAGFPLEHLLGWAEFRGLRVAVAPNVFVPRQRTGFLVDQATALARRHIRCTGAAGEDAVGSSAPPAIGPDHAAHDAAVGSAGPGFDAAGSGIRVTDAEWTGAAVDSRDTGPISVDAPGSPQGEANDGANDGAPFGTAITVLDMCCGCGALGLSLATELAADGIRVELTASDIEPAAVECARGNLAALRAPVFRGDLFDPIPADLRGRVDLLLANTPYVPSSEISWMPPEARDHEPRVALDGGSDGLDVLRRIAAVAGEWLAPGGHLLVEESEEQAATAADIMRAHGLHARIASDDELGATVVIGTRP
nr:methyltransferase [Nocardia jejuensis]